MRNIITKYVDKYQVSHRRGKKLKSKASERLVDDLESIFSLPEVRYIQSPGGVEMENYAVVSFGSKISFMVYPDGRMVRGITINNDTKK